MLIYTTTEKNPDIE